jgi:A/G-specific adenine glycosylase
MRSTKKRTTRGVDLEQLLDATARARIRSRLLRWGRDHFVIYPWRSETDPWRTFVAEFLLQRTQASQVARTFPTIVSSFSSPNAVAETPALIDLTAHLGLHFRGAQIAEIARAVIARGGSLPETLVELRSFNGVGAYTAAAWLSLHRRKRASIVDANVARWLSRMSGMSPPSDPRRVRWLRELAEALTPPKAFRAYNYAVLDFTMTICTPTSPSCRACPLRADCAYARLSTTRPIRGNAGRRARDVVAR